ncbi:RES family NAD+ phosphorylase [Lysobacter terrae]
MCCPNCFDDDFLSGFISVNAERDGQCVFCGTDDVPLIDPTRLAPYFEPVLDGYAVKVDGRSLWDLWAEDWGMFSARADARRIVQAILGGLAAATYVARDSVSAPSGEIWARLRKELQEENRFFPGNAPDKELFRVLMENLVCAQVPSQFYRSRLMKDLTPYPLDEMGAPPADLASDGRANPIGIRYLYLASDPETAISEVKPSKGALVSVATFRVAPGKELRLIDLTNPRLTISPFRVTSAIADVRASMSFLEALGEELSVPTQPHRATRDYLASQYLCELIKVSGYDGVVYRSSLADGRNFAFFDVEACEPHDRVTVYKVTDVAVTAETI